MLAATLVIAASVAYGGNQQQIIQGGPLPPRDAGQAPRTATGTRWLEDSRYVRSARPDQQGTFQIKGLPAGEYLAVALEYVEDGAWNGLRVKLLDSGSQAIALELISPQ